MKRIILLALAVVLPVSATMVLAGGSLTGTVPYRESSSNEAWPVDAQEAQASAPRIDAGPRIIHVPENYDRGYDEPRVRRPSAKPRAGYENDAAPGAVRKPRWQPSSAPVEKRTVLSASPPEPGPSPIKATPRWRTIDRFSAPPAASEPGAIPHISAPDAPAEIAPLSR